MVSSPGIEPRRVEAADGSIGDDWYNIAQTLSERAASDPFLDAVAFPCGSDPRGRTVYAHLSYQQLDALSTQAARGLLALGFTPGLRTAFMVKPSLEFFILTFALFKARTIPILIDPGIGVKHIRRCLSESKAEAFIGIAAAHAARILCRWQGAGWKRLVSTHRAGFLGRAWQKARGIVSYEELLIAGARTDAPALTPARAQDLAAVLFTSGSTGAPKGAVYTHANFRAQISLLRESLGIRVGERDLCTFPLFALFAPALGMSAIVPDMDFTRPGSVDPEKLREPIETFGVSNMFGSPALIKRLATIGLKRGWQFPSLQRVISAGAPVPATVIENFRQLIGPACDFYTPYGATEALPVAIAESRLILHHTREQTEKGQGICVGQPVRGADVRIMRISDAACSQLTSADLVPVGTVGEIIVRGEQVTAAYDQRPEATAMAKMLRLEDARPEQALGPTFYHRMGDLGYLDGEGRLWFCGRKSHRVRSAEGDLYTINCEAVFNQHPWVARTALVGLGPAPRELPALCVELQRPALSRSELDRLRQELRAIAVKYPHTASIERFYVHPKFPVDIRHNAKIFREKLKPWAELQWRKESSSRAAVVSSAKLSSGNSSNVVLPSKP